MPAENSQNSRENSQISAQNSLNFAENSARNSQFFVQNDEKIAIIVPCYNEEKSVVAVIDELFAVLPNAEIFVFDNNSTDKSAALVREKITTLNANLGQSGVKQNEVNFVRQNSTQTLANERERERERVNPQSAANLKANSTQNSQIHLNLNPTSSQNSQENSQFSLNSNQNSQISQNDNFANAKFTHPQTPSAREGALSVTQNSNQIFTNPTPNTQNSQISSNSCHTDPERSEGEVSTNGKECLNLKMDSSPCFRKAQNDGLGANLIQNSQIPSNSNQNSQIQNSTPNTQNFQENSQISLNSSQNSQIQNLSSNSTHPQTPSAREGALSVAQNSTSNSQIQNPTPNTQNSTQNSQISSNLNPNPQENSQIQTSPQSPQSPKLHLLHTATQGKGAVIADAFALIDADIYIMIDADLQYDTSILPRALAEFKASRLDMLNIAREAGSGVHRRGHSLGNKLFSKCVQMLFGARFADLLSGYRIFSRAFVKSFPARSRGFEIETELSVFALQSRLRVSELQAPYRSRLQGSFSKLSTFKDGFKILAMIISLLFTERPLLVFGALSAFCFAVGLILGIPIVVEFAQTSAVPRFPTIIAIVGLGVVGVVLAIAGLLAHLITRNANEVRRFVYLQHSHKRAK